MLKTHWRIISWIERVIDNSLVVLAFFLAYHIRNTDFGKWFHAILPLPKDLLNLGDIDRYYLVLALSIPIFNSLLTILGAYRSMRKSVWLKIFKVSIFSSAISFLCIGALLYILKLDFSRSFIGLFCLLCGMFFFIERFSVLLLLRFFRIRGKNFRNLLIVGTGKQARTIYTEVMGRVEMGIKIQGFVDVRGAVGENGDIVPNQDSQVYDLDSRVVSTVETFEDTLKKLAIDEVIFTDVVNTYPIVHELAEIAVDEGVQVTFAADLFSIGVLTSEVGSIGDIPLLHFHSSPGGRDTLPLAIKRLIDILVSSLLIVLFMPLFFLIMLAVRLDSKGSIFFKQRRVGLNGRIFTLLKFRSMVVDAEAQLENLKAKNEMTGPVFKIKHDPRITKTGNFLRRYSLDELPQLINVLRGDMSLVGPRPPLPQEVKLYKRKQRKRLSMRPGLTCSWQVSGRNDIPSFDDWAKMDLEYINNWSLKEDLRLMLKTIPAVVLGTGAR